MDANEVRYHFQRQLSPRHNTITYVGVGTPRVIGECQRLVNHSPDGPEWGYAGSAPAQAALAVLAHFTRDDDLALREHQAFKDAVIARHPEEEWTLTGREINVFLRRDGGQGVVIHGDGMREVG